MKIIKHSHEIRDIEALMDFSITWTIPKTDKSICMENFMKNLANFFFVFISQNGQCSINNLVMYI